MKVSRHAITFQWSDSSLYKSFVIFAGFFVNLFCVWCLQSNEQNLLRLLTCVQYVGAGGHSSPGSVDSPGLDSAIAGLKIPSKKF